MSKEVEQIINTLCEKLGVAANILVPEMARYNIARLAFLTVVLGILSIVVAAIIVRLVKHFLTSEDIDEDEKPIAILLVSLIPGIVLGKEIDRYIDEDGSTYHMNVKYKVMRKTGRHFPEIAAVLERMRGEQDG